jgi:hypothetical protein
MGRFVKNQQRPLLFRDVSVAEAAILGTLVERYEVEAGEVIIRQGEIGDALFIIEAGEAEARVRTPTGESVRVATRGPGDYIGEIALLTGGERTADVDQGAQADHPVRREFLVVQTAQQTQREGSGKFPGLKVRRCWPAVPRRARR